MAHGHSPSPTPAPSNRSAVLMSTSTVVVALNAQLLRRVRPGGLQAPRPQPAPAEHRVPA